MRLNDYRRNVYSQWGEDGILEQIFKGLNVETGVCVEFGAWDGKHLSNTAALIEKGWKGTLIEGDPDKFRQLRTNYQDNPFVGTFNHVVGLEGDYTLDALLQRHVRMMPLDFDLLSIDVDGCDYHIWRTVKVYRPKVVVVEFNPTIPLDVPFVQPRDMTVFQGSSLRALCELGEAMDYELVACTDTNAIFMNKELGAHMIYEGAGDPHALWIDRDKYVTHIFSLYDGTVKLAGARKLPWHGVRLNEDHMQVLPAAARKFPGAI